MEWPWHADGVEREVILVRHGQTSWNAQQRFLGHTDVPLDDVGRKQVMRLCPLGPHLDRVWSSPLLRAQETAACLGPCQVDEGLVELDQGDLEGLLAPEAIARWPDFFAAFASDPAAVHVPGGGCMGDLLRRAAEVLDRTPPGRTALVTHQMVIASLRSQVAGEPLRRWRRYCVANATVTVLHFTAHGWTEVAAGWCPAGPTPPTV